MNRELTRALYRVTESIDDAEPLKWKLREKALIFEELSEKEQVSFKEEEKRKIVLEDLLRMLELAGSLFYAGHINFAALLREYSALRENKAYGEIDKELANYNGERAPERQKKILDYLSKAPNSSIGDILSLFEARISERTIQRDLNELMIQGAVKAEGDRRWRKYALLGEG